MFAQAVTYTLTSLYRFYHSPVSWQKQQHYGEGKFILSTWFILRWLSKIWKSSWMLGTYPDCILDQIGTSKTEMNSDASLIYIYSSHSFKNVFRSVVVIQMTLPFSETSKAPVERKWVSNMLLMKNAMRQEKICKTDPSNVRNFLPCY